MLKASLPLKSSPSSSSQKTVIQPRRGRSSPARKHSFSVQQQFRSSSPRDRSLSPPQESRFLVRENSFSAQRRPQSSLRQPQRPRSAAQKSSLATSPEGSRKVIAATVNKGTIQVVTGDITREKVDAIIGSSSSKILKNAIIKVAGGEVETSYDTQQKNNPNSILISTPPADTKKSVHYQLPTTWEKPTENEMRLELSNTVDEYKSIVTNFNQSIKGKYTKIIRIERIQNERWYIQYLAHSRSFKRTLDKDTEKRTVYGFGVYFSLDAAYSHDYAKPNVNGERHMFLTRVLVGNTTKGNSSMKTCPAGFDSTTDGKHIFVTYHDAQAYAEYLITYK
ncbi:unnamed protein product [Rotaria sordida]|uniref:Poly [ADP-ribose] polymerase n=1 Tax=Rotaria sordida TaxID=392033 RepID=A0A814TR13_9BILA|nr:unnamed protein product [Rotaria sordida]CAF1415703.1 unnamed protein product [Rotaria sordida]